jgi:diaminohydroxyphosphoribosylaminopyrimidine deaminase / 5-amino-6-(5-phosphoribosylamino)uracil reductase
MYRALQLARLGLGQVSPNPMVGCVIVHQGKIIGEGYHRRFGEAHAEVNAIRSVRDENLLTESTVYVTLEPCAHFGKTPPCADLLIEKKVGQVVIGCPDPFDQVAGKGIEKLTNAGIPVVVGVLEKECRELNKRFFTAIEKKRPYVILKWAQSADGFIARANKDSKWISNQYSRQLVHKWRTIEDGILVGKNTALQDDPKLTAREWTGRNPVRIVLDNYLELPADSHLLDNSVRTIVANHARTESKNGLEYLKYDGSIEQLLKGLLNQGLHSVIIEGGSQVLKSFIQCGLWDEARVFTAPVSFGQGLEAPPVTGEILETRSIEGDELRIWRNNPERN